VTLQQPSGKSTPDLPVNDVRTMKPRVNRQPCARRYTGAPCGLILRKIALLFASGSYGVLRLRCRTAAPRDWRRMRWEHAWTDSQPVFTSRTASTRVWCDVGGSRRCLTGRAMQTLLFGTCIHWRSQWGYSVMGLVSIIACLCLLTSRTTP